MDVNNQQFFITLTDSDGNTGTFDTGFTDGVFFEGEKGFDFSAETAMMEFYDEEDELLLTLDGNAWRDLDNAESLEAFLRDVIIGGDDAEDFLILIAAELEMNEPGKVL